MLRAALGLAPAAAAAPHAATLSTAAGGGERDTAASPRSMIAYSPSSAAASPPAAHPLGNEEECRELFHTLRGDMLVSTVRRVASLLKRFHCVRALGTCFRADARLAGAAQERARELVAEYKHRRKERGDILDEEAGRCRYEAVALGGSAHANRVLYDDYISHGCTPVRSRCACRAWQPRGHVLSSVLALLLLRRNCRHACMHPESALFAQGAAYNGVRRAVYSVQQAALQAEPAHAHALVLHRVRMAAAAAGVPAPVAASAEHLEAARAITAELKTALAAAQAAEAAIERRKVATDAAAAAAAATAVTQRTVEARAATSLAAEAANALAQAKAAALAEAREVAAKAAAAGDTAAAAEADRGIAEALKASDDAAAAAAAAAAQDDADEAQREEAVRLSDAAERLKRKRDEHPLVRVPSAPPCALSEHAHAHTRARARTPCARTRHVL